MELMFSYPVCVISTYTLETREQRLVRNKKKETNIRFSHISLLLSCNLFQIKGKYRDFTLEDVYLLMSW